jgi:cytochrome c-type biogenesis protein CcmH
VTWLVAIALALAAFAVAVFAFRVDRGGWTTVAAALALGLAGYALQASPELPGAPARPPAEAGEAGWQLVELRKELVGSDSRSTSDKLIVADGFARRGQYADAAGILRSAVNDSPSDSEAWLALGNALVEHADGALTQPALLAYRRAEALDPGGLGPAFFLGLALIRQGRFEDARGLWRGALDAAPEDAAGREALAERLARLESLFTQPPAAPAPVPQ